MFYPADPGELARQVDGFLAAARAPTTVPPKAVIAPHAGYVYSGAIAASVYAHLAPLAGGISRVVLLGPAHRVAVAGLAVPSVAAFATPLGPVPVDRAAIAVLADLPFVEQSDPAHQMEHSLEVQLPFLQKVLGDFSVVPLVVGNADGAAVAAVLERLWGGPETLIVISSDLSHYQDYATARRLDADTRGAIETLALDELDGHDACGARPIEGLLRAARRHDLRATTIDLRNSGDTAGSRDQVVGYGGWTFAANTEVRISAEGRDRLLQMAGAAIHQGVVGGGRPSIDPEEHDLEITCRRASFVTLRREGRLRGCIGGLQPSRPLIADVALHAQAAAFQDPRFAAMTETELDGLEIGISVLGVIAEMTFDDQDDLLRQLRPGLDGLLLEEGGRRGTFLPQVWKTIPEPADFLSQLKLKAGLPGDFWSPRVRISRYSTESFEAPLWQ
jgi:hypothetical protein